MCRRSATGSRMRPPYRRLLPALSLCHSFIHGAGGGHRDDPPDRAGLGRARHPGRGADGRHPGLVPCASRRSAQLGHPGGSGRRRRFRGMDALADGRAQAGQRRLRSRPAGADPPRHAAPDGGDGARHDRRGRGPRARVGLERAAILGARIDPDLLPRDRLRRRPGLRRRGREPRGLGRPPRGAGDRRVGALGRVGRVLAGLAGSGTGLAPYRRGHRRRRQLPRSRHRGHPGRRPPCCPTGRARLHGRCARRPARGRARRRCRCGEGGSVDHRRVRGRPGGVRSAHARCRRRRSGDPLGAERVGRLTRLAAGASPGRRR